MLGKGLESLIPQKGTGNNDNYNSQNNGQVSNGSPIDSSMQSESSRTNSAPVSQSAQASEPLQQPEPIQESEPIQPLKSPEKIEAQQKNLFDVQSPSSQGRTEISGSIFQIEVEKIEPNPDQPRRHFDETALRDLARSIREFGFLQPLVVTKVERETHNGIDVEYQLIAGERRLLAAKLLGLRLVPAIIRNVRAEREKLELAVIENIQRENLNPIETARAFQRLQEEFRMTQREIAAKLGKSRETVANTMRLLDLPEYIQKAVQEGQLSESHARLLLSIGDPAAQKRLFDDVVANRLTTRDMKDRVRDLVRPRGTHLFGADGAGADGRGGAISPELREAQERLSSALGAPVEIHKGAGPGKITIVFYSQEELENILGRVRGGDGEAN